jgi:predicted RNA-binding protein with PIN domain
MPYLIDGHNLIPKMGIKLADLDDELTLVEQLREFSRVSRRGQLEVYFDNAPPEGPESRRSGQVTAHFVRKPLIADQAIANRLRRLGRGARNWSVVSSDHRVQNEARSMGAKVISSEEFAITVIETLRAGAGTPHPGEKHMSDHELDEWLKLFDDKDHKFGQF